MFDKFKKKTQKDEKKWFIATAQDDGKQIIFRIRNKMPDGIQPTDFPVLVTIHWPYEETSNQGLPAKSIYKKMCLLEDLLDEIELSKLGFMMVTVTGNQCKEWGWHVCSSSEFLYAVNQILGKLEPFPIEIQFQDDPEWSSYKMLLTQTGK